jgi:hypothetical protein
MSRSTISSYELNRRFPTLEPAQKYMEERRWGGKPKCPSCGEVNLVMKRRDAGVKSWEKCFPVSMQLRFRSPLSTRRFLDRPSSFRLVHGFLARSIPQSNRSFQTQPWNLGGSERTAFWEEEWIERVERMIIGLHE